jgi:hypothetical protein
LQIVSRVAAEMLGEDGKPVKAPYGGDRARDRAWRQSFVHQAVDETFKVVTVEALDGFFQAGGEFSKALEIATITFKSVIGEASFDAQVRHIRVDEIVSG